MAFGFFRRRQKMVIIVMVVLMVSFLIGFQGFNILFQRNPGKITIGRAGGEKITLREFRAAKADIHLISRYVNLPSVGYASHLARAPYESAIAYLYLLRNKDKALAYTLLLREARKSGMIVTDGDVDGFFERIGLTGARWDAMLSMMRSEKGLTEKMLRTAVRNWLTIIKSCQSANVNSPPSEPMLQRLFRDLTEKIELAVVKVPAENFVDKVRAPTAEEVQAQFKAFSGNFPGFYANRASFGFGYRQPNRVGVVCLLVNRDVIRQVVKPTEDQARAYYLEHKAEFVERVPVAPRDVPAEPTTPATGAAEDQATQATSEPQTRRQDTQTARVEYRQVQRKFSQVKQRVMEMLSVKVADAKTEDTAAGAERLLEELSDAAETLPAGKSVYEVVETRMTLPANHLLGKTVNVRLENLSPEAAMRKLAKAADLAAICSPFARQEKDESDAEVRVTLTGSMTLGQALTRIAGQLKYTPPDWVRCEGFESVLFPIGGEAGRDFLPVSARRTDMITAEELNKDEILGASFTQLTNGQSLVGLAFSAGTFDKDRRSEAGMEIGADGPRMYVFPQGIRFLFPGMSAQGRGILLWRLEQTVGAHKATQITPEIHARIVKDLKIQAAFALAAEQARKLEAAALKGQLASAAKAADLEVEQTEMFARREIVSPHNAILMQAQRFGRQDLLYQLPFVQPVAFQWHDLPELSLPQVADLHTHLMERIFSLTPKDVEPPHGDDAPAAAVVPLPARREVAVVLRVDYRPAVIGEYESHGRDKLAMILLAIRRFRERATWFDLRKIKERVRFVPETKR